MVLSSTLAAVVMFTVAGTALARAPCEERAPAACSDSRHRSLVELATRYEHGEGVPRDQGQANRLYCHAAREGDAEAQFRLAWAHANGRGGMRDELAAAALFAMAAARGHDYARRMLAYLPAADGGHLPPCMIVERTPGPPRKNDAAAPVEAPVPTAWKDAGAPAAIRAIVDRLAPQYAVDPRLALAVIAVESAFQPTAVSPRNALGLMQLVPETAARFGVKQPFDPVDNIKGGLAYLRWLLAFFEGDVRLVVAAYNAGERAVERYRGVPPYQETREYVRKISALYPLDRHPYVPDAAARSALKQGLR